MFNYLKSGFILLLFLFPVASVQAAGGIALGATRVIYPADAKQRAIIDQWIDWQGIELNNSWTYALMNLFRHSPDHQDPKLVEKSIQAWSKMMKIVEQQLEKTGAYITGEHFSLADIVIGLSVQRWYLTPFDKPDYP